MKSVYPVVTVLFFLTILLTYQFVYKDYAYRREVVAERDLLLARIEEGGKEYDSILQEKNDCSSRHGRLNEKCNALDARWADSIKRQNDLYDRLDRLHRAVVSRHGGLSPSWWTS
ncbi:MAG TPA: hypothetical protein VGR30_10900 [Candidatus Binatia bacterium]|nr:hypothetical protein [Candidatus Binatia bacterium]